MNEEVIEWCVYWQPPPLPPENHPAFKELYDYANRNSNYARYKEKCEGYKGSTDVCCNKYKGTICWIILAVTIVQVILLAVSVFKHRYLLRKEKCVKNPREVITIIVCLVLSILTLIFVIIVIATDSCSNTIKTITCVITLVVNLIQVVLLAVSSDTKLNSLNTAPEISAPGPSKAAINEGISVPIWSVIVSAGLSPCVRVLCVLGKEEAFNNRVVVICLIMMGIINSYVGIIFSIFCLTGCFNNCMSIICGCLLAVNFVQLIFVVISACIKMHFLEKSRQKNRTVLGSNE